MNTKSLLPNFGKSADLQPLTPEEISERLRTENREIIQELYSLVMNLQSTENDRTKALDAKAAALFGFVGAVISAIFVVLGFLSDPKNSVRCSSSTSRFAFAHTGLLVVALYSFVFCFF